MKSNKRQNDITNLSFVQKLAQDLIKSRKNNYSEDCVSFYFQENKFIMQDLPNIKNKYNNLLKCTLIQHRLSLLEKVQMDFMTNKMRPTRQQAKQQKIIPVKQEKCIIYLHGLGSNRLQGFSLLPHMPKGYCIVTFDLSGSGKSQGDYTTYGYREKQDIQALLIYLYHQRNYRNFIIWGRSMGAVATLLFSNMMAQKEIYIIDNNCKQTRQNQQDNNFNLSKIYKSVKCIVSDSPFCSFESIAKDIASKRMSIPTFLSQIGLTILQKLFNSMLQDKKLKKNFNPFQVNFQQNKLNPIIPMIFIYSLNDEVVNCNHSQKIISSIENSKKKLVEKIIIPECGHNHKRPQNVFQAIFQKVQKHVSNSISKQNSHVNSHTNQLRSATKNVRKKSFWNFQENLDFKKKGQLNDQNDQVPSHDNSTNNKFVNNSIVNDDKKVPQRRNNMFTRESSVGSIKSITKKRGISLSSTIQRDQRQPLQIKNNKNQMQTLTSNNSIQLQKETFHLKRKRNFSVQLKPSHKQIEIQNLINQSPRENLLKGSIKLMNQNFEQSSYRKPPNSASRLNRTLGGGSSDRKRQPSKDKQKLFSKNDSSNKHKIINSTISFDFGQNIYSYQKSESQISSIRPQKDSKRVYLSTISYDPIKNTSRKPFSLSNTNIPINNNNISQKSQYTLKSQKIISQNQEQNMKSQQFKSSQSLKTIDVMIGIDEDTRSFINKKLQFNFNNWTGIGSSSSTTTINSTTNQTIPSSTNNIQSHYHHSHHPINHRQLHHPSYNHYHNTIHHPIYSFQNSYNNSNLISAHNNPHPHHILPNHLNLLLHPTITTTTTNYRTFHHQKRKKKSIHPINKTIENMRITNDKYLIDIDNE